MTGWLALALHAALLLAAAPALAGVLRAAAARIEGRTGPPLAQPWRDLRRLVRKRPVLPDGASWVFAAAPGASLAALLAAAVLVPSFTLGMAAAPLSDLLVIAGLLALSRAALMLGAYDAGAALPALAADRLGLLRAGLEPALLLVILALALLGGSTNLDALCAALRDGGARWPLVPAVLAAGIVALAEAGRGGFGAGPLPGPAAQAWSGRHLAMLELAAQLRVLVWLSVLAALCPPYAAAPGAGFSGWAWGLLAWALKLGLLSLPLLALEAGLPRLRPGQAAGLLGAAMLLAALALVALFAGQGLA